MDTTCLCFAETCRNSFVTKRNVCTRKHFGNEKLSTPLKGHVFLMSLCMTKSKFELCADKDSDQPGHAYKTEETGFSDGKLSAPKAV